MDPQGKTDVVYGGSSLVRSMAVQLVSPAEYHFLAIASKKNPASVKEAGTEKFFDYADPKVVDGLFKAIDISSTVGI